MTTDLAPASSEELTGQSAIDAMSDELRSIDPTKVGNFNLDATFAATAALRAYDGVAKHLPELLRLPDFDRRHVDRLKVYAHALIHANALVMAHSPETSKFDELAARSRVLRDDFLRVADVLVGRGVLPMATVDKIREGQGHLDLIADLAALVVIAEANVATGLFRPEDLASAQSLVRALPDAYAQHTGRDPKLEPMMMLRRSVGAVLTNACSEITAGLRYMRRSFGDADAIAPAIYVPRGGAKKDTAEAVKPTPIAPVVPVTPSPAAPSNPLLPSDNPFDDNR